MDFTYDSYKYMLELLKSTNYVFSSYTNNHEFEKGVILRHDIDFTLQKALEIARIEHSMRVNSTYFVLLSTNFYNVFSKESIDIIQELGKLGHEIGLHFDEKTYEITGAESLEYYINKERNLLEEHLGIQIRSVSMHRPSNWILKNDFRFKGFINTYSNYYMENFKYLSDSRMLWREDIINIIENKIYNRLHILTHPFWYSEKRESMKEKLIDFIIKSKADRYHNVKENFRNIEEVLTLEELL